MILVWALLISLSHSVMASASRAAWIPVSDGHFPTINESDILFLSQIGITRLYVDVWNNGVVYFNSSTMAALVPDDKAFGGDMLGEVVSVIESLGLTNMEVVAWFEYGLMAAYNDSTIGANAFFSEALRRRWILGESTNCFVYLQPNNTEVLQFIVGMIEDVSATYASRRTPTGAQIVRGSQLDDHFNCPIEFSECSVDVMNTAAQYVSAHVQPIMALLLAPTTPFWALSQGNVNWTHWMDDFSPPLFSEIAVQVYDTNFSCFPHNLVEVISACSAATRRQLTVGLRINGIPLTPWVAVEEMINATTVTGYGIALWEVSGILSSYRSNFLRMWG